VLFFSLEQTSPMPQPQMTGPIRFGAFEVDPHRVVVRKHGVRIRLQDQPFRVLLALLEQPGEMVTREELQRKVWPESTFGDLDHNLNIAINKIRETLGDSAESPRFVETLPRRGYRFIAPVEGTLTPGAAPARVKARMPRWILPAGAAMVAVVLATSTMVWLLPSAPPELIWSRLTNDSLPKTGPVLSDGTRLYFQKPIDVGLEILQVPVSGGEPARLSLAPPPGYFYALLDITSDGQELLLAALKTTLSDEGGALWAWRVVDGSSRRLGSLVATIAKYSPDGTQIAFGSGEAQTASSLWVASSGGSNVRRLLELKDREIVLPCWSADGRRIIFGQIDRATQEQSAWDIGVNGAGLRRLLPNFGRNHLPAGLRSDGSLLIVSEGQFWIAQQWRFFLSKHPPPRQLSTGDTLFSVPIQLQHSGTFYSVGTTRLSELQRLDARSGRWYPHLGGIYAGAVDYSRDGQAVVYCTPEGELWVRRADGSRPVQLTRAPMETGIGRWSPDGRVIAFSAKRMPDQPWSIYLVDAAGGSVRPACPSQCSAMDLSWMPDGKKIVFSAPIVSNPNVEPYLLHTEKNYLRLLDLATGVVTKFPGSEGFHSPRMSPDGSTLAALDFIAGNELAIYVLSEGVWKKLPQPGPGGVDWPSWSHDGQSIWYYDSKRGAVMRCLVRENRHDEMLKLREEEMAGSAGSFFNLTPDDTPMIARRHDVQQIYALQLKPR
jgi:DNA-binding winged helix-turn-helix (wHTH) protein/Tol biopolymer transport system component